MVRLNVFKSLNRFEDTLYPIIKQNCDRGIFIEISPVIKTLEEMKEAGSFLIWLKWKNTYDPDRFLSTYFKELKIKLNNLGAKRIKEGDTWYWILKENFHRYMTNSRLARDYLKKATVRLKILNLPSLFRCGQRGEYWSNIRNAKVLGIWSFWSPESY